MKCLLWQRSVQTILCSLSKILRSYNLFNHSWYRKIASSNTSHLEAHASFFRLLMKGIFDPYVLWPFDKKLISKLVTRVRTHDYTVCDIIVSSNWIRCSWCKKGFIPLYHMKVAIYQILTLAHFIYIFGLLSEGDFPKWKVVGQGGSVYVSPSFFLLLLLLPEWTECC